MPVFSVLDFVPGFHKILNLVTRLPNEGVGSSGYAQYVEYISGIRQKKYSSIMLPYIAPLFVLNRNAYRYIFKFSEGS